MRRPSEMLSLAVPNYGRSIINNRKMFYNNCRQKCKCITSRSSILLRCLTASQMVRTKFKKQFYMNKFELVMLGQNNEIIKRIKFSCPLLRKKFWLCPRKVWLWLIWFFVNLNRWTGCRDFVHRGFSEGIPNLASILTRYACIWHKILLATAPIL